jgi:hypothetical protein
MDNNIGPEKFAPFFGMAGIASAMIFGCAGAAYGTAKSGIGIASVGTFRPDLIMKVSQLLDQDGSSWPDAASPSLRIKRGIG